MKFSIFNLLSILTIIALVIALVISQSTKTVSIETSYIGIRDVPEAIAQSSLWKDRSKPPPISASEAHELILKQIQNLSPLPGAEEWKFNYISLENLDVLGEHCWVYVVELERLRRVPAPSHYDLENAQILIAMDGTVILEGGNYPNSKETN